MTTITDNFRRNVQLVTLVLAEAEILELHNGSNGGNGKIHYYHVNKLKIITGRGRQQN